MASDLIPPDALRRVLREYARHRDIDHWTPEQVDQYLDYLTEAQSHVALAQAAYAEGVRAALAGAEQATTDARRVVEAAKAWRRWKNFEYRAGEINPHLLTAHQEDLDLARAVDALAADLPAAADDHGHPGGYLSTACLHGLCEPECGAAQRARGDLSAPHCKYCPAPCTHSCHTGGQVERAERVHVDGCTLAADDPHHAGWCVLPLDPPADDPYWCDAEGHLTPLERISDGWARCSRCGERFLSDVPAAGEAEVTP